MSEDSPDLSGRPPPRLEKTIALVGLMGAGKSSVGRRLANELGVPFRDADDEIVIAAGRPIPEIFADRGEDEFRAGERRVIARLLDDPPHVLATGGGAFMNPVTRVLMRQRAVTIWLRADLETLVKRVGRRDDRPLLKGADPRVVLARLMQERHPIYAEADLVVDSRDGPHQATVAAVLEALARRQAEGVAAEPPEAPAAEPLAIPKIAPANPRRPRPGHRHRSRAARGDRGAPA
jgi:shikimate kinase